MEASAGAFLKEVRWRLHLGVRDVQAASAVIAAQEHNQEFYISASRLAQIENDGSLPGMHKIFSISAIYGLDFLDLLSRYGINPDRAHSYRALLKLDATHPVSADVHGLDSRATLPARLDPSFSWETTQLVNRIVALWGEIPAAFLQSLNPREYMYGYVGLADLTMYPLLRPGALVMIDGRRRRVAQTGFTSEFERPIYFVELREGYRCAWCEVEGNHIILIPHPMSPVTTEAFNFPNEAEVVGQVVGVAMRLVLPECPNRGREQEPSGLPLSGK